MPIIKKVTYDNGSTPEYHLPKSLRYDFDLQVSQLHVVSYVDEEAFLAGKPLCANWQIIIPTSAITADIEGSINAYLIGGADSPFLGGVVSTPGADDIEDARARKIYLMNEYCTQQIYAGFVSAALGTPHVYPANTKDQTNLVASVTASLYPDLPADWTTPFWCADADGTWAYAMHTALQIQQVGADGKAAIVASLIKNETLRAQIDAATTQAELDLITW